MKIIHQFCEGWRLTHRLVLERSDGTRVEGEWARYEHPAFLTDHEIEEGTGIIISTTDGVVPISGYMGFTDYYQGCAPRLTRYGIPVDHIEYTTEEVKEGEAEDVPKMEPLSTTESLLAVAEVQRMSDKELEAELRATQLELDQELGAPVGREVIPPYAVGDDDEGEAADDTFALKP
jgi:hypothetical protein